MNILGVETSCDETSASVVKNGRVVLSNIVASQIAVHRKFFGVVPELASREHLENINWIVESAVTKAGFALPSMHEHIDAISYTRGPGLAGALLVGQITAQTLSFVHRIPLVEVNHLEGHLYAALLESPKLAPPYLGLIVSGGHTELVLVKDFGTYTYIGATRDDAAGEAFDKVAKLLHLSYPGGPVIDALAKKGDPEAIRFPRPYLWPSWDFSFSGLKTAVVNYVQPQERFKTRQAASKQRRHASKADICASFQEAVVETLVEKTIQAAKKYGMKKIVIGGGVAANSALRNRFQARGKKEKLSVFIPSLPLCTDNAAMIACAGYYAFTRNKGASGIGKTASIEPGLPLKNW